MPFKDKLDIYGIIKSVLIVGGLYTIIILLTIQFNKTHESLLMEYTFPINLFNVYYPEIGTLIFGTMGFINEIVNIGIFIVIDLILMLTLTLFLKRFWLLTLAFLACKVVFFLLYFAIYFETVIKLIRTIT